MAKPTNAMRTQPLAELWPPITSNDWTVFAPLDLPPTYHGALAVFSEKGYYGTTVRDVAERVGVTVPTLYYHHANKQAVLVSLLNTGFGELLARAEAAAQAAGDDAVAGFRNVVIASTLHMTNRHDLAILDAELRHLEPENRVHYAALRSRLETLLRDLVIRGMNEGHFRVTYLDDTCRAIWGMLSSIAMWYRHKGPLTPEELAARYCQLALRAVGANSDIAATAW